MSTRAYIRDGGAEMSLIIGRRSGLRTIATIALVALSTILAVHFSKPADVRRSELAGTFSTSRALDHVRRIAREPHPTGSVANIRVRAYLLAQLNSMGMRAEVQRELVTQRDRSGKDQFAWIENVVGVLPGARRGEAVLLMAHYDSVPWAPGAADDGAGVATILETLRVVSIAKTPRERDLVVLLSDGEEIGLFGAREFFARHPFAEQISTVLNFEARGSRGPALMFQTSDGNADLIRLLADVPSPAGYSYAHEIYKHMSNDTDFTVALSQHKRGMNFAFVDGFFDYHSPSDTVANLAPESLQHMGDQALSLTRVLISEPASAARGEDDAHYMNLSPQIFFHYPPWLDSVALALATVLLGFAAWAADRCEGFGLSALVRGAIAAAAGALVALAVVYVVASTAYEGFWQDITLSAVTAQQSLWFTAWSAVAVGTLIALLGNACNGLRWPWALAFGAALALLPILRTGPWMPAAVLVGGLVFALLFTAMRKPLAYAPLIHGANLLLLGLAWSFVIMIPGAANVLVWPLLVFGIAHAFAAERNGWAATFAFALSAIISTLILGVLALNLDLAIGASMPLIGSLPLLLLFLASAALWLTPSAMRIGAGLAVAGTALAIILALRNPFDARYPQPSGVFVLHDRIQHVDCLASTDQVPTGWWREVMGDDPQMLQQNNYAPETVLHTRCAPLRGNRLAALAPMSMPLIESLRVEPRGDLRRLHLRIRVDGGSDILNLYVPGGVDLRGLHVEGKALETPLPGKSAAWPWQLRGFAVSDSGVAVSFDIGPGPLPKELLLVSTDYGFPAGLNLPPRPVGVMAQPHPFSDMRILTSRALLPAPAAQARSAAVETSGSDPDVP